MTQEMLIACNRVNAELQTERFNTRMMLISRLFSHDRFLGVDEKSLKIDRLYYAHEFDLLMDMSLCELEEREIKMFKITKDYGEHICSKAEAEKHSIV